MKEKSSIRQMLDASTVGIHMVAATFVGLGFGYMLDSYFGTRPWLTLLFLFLGIGTGFRDMFSIIKRIENQEDDNSDDGQAD